jgi:hypothetical protein
LATADRPAAPKKAAPAGSFEHKPIVPGQQPISKSGRLQRDVRRNVEITRPPSLRDQRYRP